MSYIEKRKRAGNRVNRKFVILLLAIITTAGAWLYGYEGRLDPSEVVILWHESMHDGEVQTLERYTSETASTYIADRYGTLSDFSIVYYTRQSRGHARIINADISGDVATVVSISCYDDGRQQEWEDTLFLEDGIWRLAPQFVRTRPAPASAC